MSTEKRVNKRIVHTPTELLNFLLKGFGYARFGVDIKRGENASLSPLDLIGLDCIQQVPEQLMTILLLVAFERRHFLAHETKHGAGRQNRARKHGSESITYAP